MRPSLVRLARSLQSASLLAVLVAVLISGGALGAGWAIPRAGAAVRAGTSTKTTEVATYTIGRAHISPVMTRHDPGAGGQRRSYDLGAGTITHGPCINNDCPYPGAQLVYHGGALLSHPTVYLVRFTDGSGSIGGFTQGVYSTNGPNGLSAAAAVVASPSGDWWRAEYSTGGYQLGVGTVAGVVTVTDPTLANELVVSDAQISAALASARADGALGTGSQAIYVVTLKAGQISYLGTPSVNSLNTYCGYHSAASDGSFTYAVLPNETTNQGCMSGAVSNNGASDVTGAGAANGLSPSGVGAESSFDDFSSLLSHELIETITNPYATGWSTNGDGTTGGAALEIADLCAQGPGSSGLVSADGITYSLQYVYSNVTGGCQVAPYATTITGSYPVAGSLTLHLSGTDEGVAGATLDVTVNGVSQQLVTGADGVTHISVAPGDVVTADVGAGSGVTASPYQAIAPASSGTLSGAITVTHGNLTLSGTVVGASSGMVAVYGPYGQLTGSGTVDSDGAYSATLSGVVNADTVTVSYDGSAAVADLALTIPQSATVSVAAPAVSLAGEPYVLTATISPAEANATVIVFNGSNYVQATTGPNGIGTVGFTDQTAGPTTLAVYVLARNNDLSSYVNVDFRAAVTALLSVTPHSVSGALSYGIGDSLARTVVHVGVGPTVHTVTTDGTGNFSLNSTARAGSLVSLRWPTTPYVEGGATYLFAPGQASGTLAQLIRGVVLVNAAGNATVALRNGTLILTRIPGGGTRPTAEALRSVNLSDLGITTHPRGRTMLRRYATEKIRVHVGGAGAGGRPTVSITAGSTVLWRQ